jgi:DNA-binding transcriptional regulator YiaG
MILTPIEMKSIRDELNLSRGEFGKALGLSDGRRIVEAWEAGYRGGEPFAPTGSALVAIGLLRAV